MVDHGADAATVVANAATDITKGMMQISAAGLKQLFLLLYEGKQLKIGETNIEKLIKMLDEGDRITDMVVQKEHVKDFVELSHKHGVSYAVAEMPDGKMVVYYPESQSNRVENIMNEILGSINHNQEEKQSLESNVAEETFDQVNAGVDVPSYVKSFYDDVTFDQSKTAVFFDSQNPNHYTTFSKIVTEDRATEINCFIKSEEIDNEPKSIEVGIEEASKYESRMCFEVEGEYSQDKIEEQIQDICVELKARENKLKAANEKKNLIDNIESRGSSLGGSIYIIQNQENPGNLVVIQKQLQPLENGEWKTSNTTKVFTDGRLNDQADPRQTVLQYENFTIIEKHGKGAMLEYENILSGDYFKPMEMQSELNAIQSIMNIEEKEGESTVVIFDGQNSDHYIKLSQEAAKEGYQVTCISKLSDGTTKEVSKEEAALEASSFEKRMSFEVEGVYKEDQIQEHIHQLCEDIKKQQLEKEALQGKEKIIDDILAKNSGLEGSIHTIADGDNKNNMIVIYKHLEPTQEGQFKTANKVMVYADGKLTEKITPKQAIVTYEKYKVAEKQGKSAERQYQRMLSGEYFHRKELSPEVFAIQNSLVIKKNEGEKTVVFFDGRNPNHYVKISQEKLQDGSFEVKRMARLENGLIKPVSNEAAAIESYQYEQRMHFEVDGLYTDKEIEEHINKVCTDIKKQDIAKEVIRDKENLIDNILAKNSSLNGSIHTISDANNRNNMIVIHKQLEQTPGGEFKTVNRVMIFCNGELNKDMTPKQAILSYGKYKTMEKQGKSAEKYLDRIVSGEIFKEKNADKENPEKDMDSGRKPLSEYEKEIEKIKELEPKKVERKESVMESPMKAVKETAEIGR